MQLAVNFVLTVKTVFCIYKCKYLFFSIFSFKNSIKGTFTLENISKLPVDNMSISVSSKDGEGKANFYYTVSSKGEDGKSNFYFTVGNNCGEGTSSFYYEVGSKGGEGNS